MRVLESLLKSFQISSKPTVHRFQPVYLFLGIRGPERSDGLVQFLDLLSVDLREPGCEYGGRGVELEGPPILDQQSETDSEDSHFDMCGVLFPIGVQIVIAVWSLEIFQ